MVSKSNEIPTHILQAVKKTKLHEQIVSQIQALIDNGRLKYGDQLPPERELATIFKVSRHSLREAIRILEHKKVLKSRAGSGTYIILEEESAVVEFLAAAIKREKNTLDEIFQFREMLEPQIAALAARHATSADHKVIQDLLEQQKKEVNNDESSRFDQDFHLALARATGNAVLLHIVEVLGHIFSKSRHAHSQSPHRQELSIQGHQQIAKAIVEERPEAARDLMAGHLRTIREFVLSTTANHEG
jgi:GntR family transcriptional regulator, transcriptional repressor for pyruvate dehydrogenase complex